MAPLKPQWIAKMYPGKTGRDHLGLGSVSADQILPSLSPGINVLTIHPRYHSFYTFLLDEFWRRELPRTRKAWVDFYRPREFIFSVGCYLCPNPEHGEMGSIVGGLRTSPLASSELTHFDTTTSYIDSDLGGYGLYYRSVIAEMGLIYPGGRGLPLPVDVPSELGKKVADAFRSAVHDTRYYREFIKENDTQVPRDVVIEYIRRACLCQLKKEPSPDRKLLIDLFLNAGGEKEAAARHGTFRLLLDIADKIKDAPIDANAFRLLIYFGEIQDGTIYLPSDDLLSVYRRWRLYQTREYYAFALNALWYYFCDWGLRSKGDLRPVGIGSFWDHLEEAALDFHGLANMAGIADPGLDAHSSFNGLLAWLGSLIDESEAGLDGPRQHDSPLSEACLHQLASDEPSDPSIMVAGMVAMLALIYLRHQNKEIRLFPEWDIARMGGGDRLGVDRYIRWLERTLQAGHTSILNIARGIFANYIILQHQLVATGKLPDNTFRYRREGTRLHFFPHDNFLGFNNSRYEALSTTLLELGLCEDLTEPSHQLTLDGKKLLQAGSL